jgi:hypothetical protein
MYEVEIYENKTTEKVTAVSDEVKVTVKHVNKAPVIAEITPSAWDVDEGGSVSLTAGLSDPDGDSFSYLWEQISGPAGTLQNAASAKADFIAPEVTKDSGVWFKLTVTDSRGAAAEYTMPVHIRIKNVNKPPVVNAGIDQSIDENKIVTLSATATDGDLDMLTYNWIQTTGPPAAITNADKATAAFTAPEVAKDTELIFRVTISDGTDTVSDEVTVTVLQVDTTPPTTPEFLYMDYNRAIDLLEARAICNEAESKVTEFRYRITINSPDGEVIKDWTAVSAEHNPLYEGRYRCTLNLEGLGLDYVNNYYVNVKAINSDGLESDVLSGAIEDSLAPSHLLTAHANYDISTDQVLLRGTAVDNESGVSEFQYQVVRDDGPVRPIIRDWTSMPAHYTGTTPVLEGEDFVYEYNSVIDGLNLKYAENYLFNVKAIDNAGNESDVYSNYIIVRDTTPPTALHVTQQNKIYGNNPLLVNVSASDGQSGVDRFEYKITKGSPDGTIIRDWTSTEANYESRMGYYYSDFDVKDLDLSWGNKYYINVRAINGQGLESGIVSEDISIDNPNLPAAPEVSQIFYGNDILHVYGYSYDDKLVPQIDLFGFEYKVTEGDPAGPIIRDWTVISANYKPSGPEPQDRYHYYYTLNAEGLNLQQGKTYYVSIKAVINVTNEESVVISKDITVEGKTPDHLEDTISYDASTDQLHIKARAYNLPGGEKGVPEEPDPDFRFEYSITKDSADGAVVKDWSSLGANYFYSYATGLYYFIDVNVDNAGLVVGNNYLTPHLSQLRTAESSMSKTQKATGRRMYIMKTAAG